MNPKPINSDASETVSQPQTLPEALIKNLIKNYRENQLSVINTELGIDDAHSIFFTLEGLKKFIHEIEFETKKVNPAITDDKLGIRFYYAAYPTAQNWSIMNGLGVDENFARRHTLLMVPTLKMEDETGALLDYDFNPLDPSTYTRNPVSGENEDSSRDVTDFLVKNHGQLIPPSDPKVEMF